MSEPASDHGATRTTHYRERMRGRDPAERGRAATPLELLFDLTFVIAFGAAADELAHALAEDHVVEGVLAFALATFAVSWAWINFSWFASAYDTDDWVYRLTTMVQMVGVLVLALGIPDLFASANEGESLDLRVMVAGYVVMRLTMLAQWWRASRHDEARRPQCRAMMTTLAVAQVGWVAMALLDLTLLPAIVVFVVLVGVELGGPLRAEHLGGGTPWHPHHIAERYGLLVIITLGEGLLGTVAALSVLVGPEGPGWSTDVAVLGLAGTALTFGLWWNYFVIPFAPMLHAHQERSFGWGYGHLPLFGALAAVGGGLHVGAYYLEHHTELGVVATVLATAVPVAVFTAVLYTLYAQTSRTWDPFHALLLTGSGVVLAASVLLAAAGVPLVWCLLVLALTPWVTVVGYETVGHRHNERVLGSL